MTALEASLRELVRELVSDEVRRQMSAIAKPDEFLTAQGAAKLASVADATIRRWVRTGKLEAHRAGRVVRVRRADLERLLCEGARRDHALSPEELARRDFG